MTEPIIMIEKYQALIAGTIAFTGVMTTLWWNAKLQREQRHHEMDQKANALRTSLIAELKENEDVLQFYLDQFGPLEADQEIEMVVNPRRQIFDAQIKELGLLDEAELERVLSAYDRCAQLIAYDVKEDKLVRPNWATVEYSADDAPNMKSAIEDAQLEVLAAADELRTRKQQVNNLRTCRSRFIWS